MKKTLFYPIILIIILWNCSDKKDLKQTEFVIGNNEKVEFLNEILSDTINLKLLSSQKIMISDFNFLPKLPHSILNDNEFKRVSYIKYLSHHLKEKDTVFIKKQIKQNKTFDLKILSKYNYQILNTSKLFKNGVSVDSLSTIALNKQIYTKELYNEPYILIDKPIFNKEMNRVCLSLNRPNSGEYFVFIKKNRKWQKEVIAQWSE
ncbi:hypothetical protein CXF68_15670 [Tenacibaculum sp. Bg11-29]|uniref:hypothetical protein n=1 Tax=Tenacibaculum sp. Bg11-29 TaxID=2058306 RepID=UPI000C34EC92|nr:hypothetical protein [Tenacibaculum sp. Bg11-29]PKH52043.1 hypothetical protein CXF68_15670 [Tenacibaculum sp. Bg11-29]